MSAMDSHYYRMTTVFAIAQFLAHKRRLVVDGVYSQIVEFDRDLGEKLEERLEAVESILGRETTHGTSLQRYHRLALAEAAMIRTDTGMTTCGYTEFLSAWEDDTSRARESFAFGFEFVDDLDEAFCQQLLQTLDEVGDLLGGSTDLTYTYKGRQAPTRD
jgi:hypothetical protein